MLYCDGPYLNILVFNDWQLHYSLFLFGYFFDCRKWHDSCFVGCINDECLDKGLPILHMKVALTVWEGKISPVFDVARSLLIVELKNGEIAGRDYVPMFAEPSSRLGEWLRELGVDVLICGAISQVPAIILETGGVRLLAFIGGNVEEVLTSFVNGEPITEIYSLPGCGRCHGWQRGRAGCMNQQAKEVRKMPGRDKTGPLGSGAGTGRGRGGCGSNQGGNTSGQGRGSGTGQRQGAGKGAGRGRGSGNKG